MEEEDSLQDIPGSMEAGEMSGIDTLGNLEDEQKNKKKTKIIAYSVAGVAGAVILALIIWGIASAAKGNGGENEDDNNEDENQDDDDDDDDDDEEEEEPKEYRYVCSPSGMCKALLSCEEAGDEECFDSHEECVASGCNPDENPPSENCNPQGTKELRDGRCHCWNGVTGLLCDSCEEGRGPGFPCCFMHEQKWEGSGKNEHLQAPCYAYGYNKNTETNKTAFFKCDTKEAGCLAYPSFNPNASRRGTVTIKHNPCEVWIDRKTGRPVQLLDYADLGQYEKDWNQNTVGQNGEEPLWVPDTVYCSEEYNIQTGNPSSDVDCRPKGTSTACVGRYQLPANFCSLTSKGPQVITDPKLATSENPQRVIRYYDTSELEKVPVPSLDAGCLVSDHF